MKSSGLMYMAGACDSDALGPVAIIVVGCCSTGEPANDIGGDGVPAWLLGEPWLTAELAAALAPEVRAISPLTFFLRCTLA